MSRRIDIPQGEYGVVRVLAVSRPIPDMSRALRSGSKEAMASDLLGLTVAPGTIEIFPVSDLTGVGLPAYLADGYDIPPDQLLPDRARLDALDGYVLMVFSSAFAAKPVTLEIGAELTLIGTYKEASADNAAHALDSAAAQSYSGTPSVTPPAAPRVRAGGAIIGLGIVVALILLLIWSLR